MASVLSLPRGELKSIGLIAIGHGFSHYYMLILPPLFTLIRADLGVSWTDLGLLIAVSAVATGIAQLPAGILVDRIGARPVLFAGLVLQAAPFALVALFPTYWGLVALVAISGIGIAVFHPADYAILAAQVDTERQGRAFGIHIFSGYAGWVVAPPIMLGLVLVLDWSEAVSVAGAGRPPLRRLRGAVPGLPRRRRDQGCAGRDGEDSHRQPPLRRPPAGLAAGADVPAFLHRARDGYGRDPRLRGGRPGRALRRLAPGRQRAAHRVFRGGGGRRADRRGSSPTG